MKDDSSVLEENLKEAAIKFAEAEDLDCYSVCVVLDNGSTLMMELKVYTSEEMDKDNLVQKMVDSFEEKLKERGLMK